MGFDHRVSISDAPAADERVLRGSILLLISHVVGQARAAHHSYALDTTLPHAHAS